MAALRYLASAGGLAAMALVVSNASYAASTEHWPEPKLSPEAQRSVNDMLAKYENAELKAVSSQSYSTEGDYLDYGKRGPVRETPGKLALKDGGVKYDEDGLPLIKRRNIAGLFFNPVTHSQFALAAHGQYVRGGTSALFLKAAERLRERQEADGSFRYHFRFRHYSMAKAYPDGWVSGMAQGQALSVFARAYLLTHDEKYRIAGDKALDFLLTPEEEGGPATTLADLDPSLSDYIFFEEYVTEPDVYTLNGYIFIMLGLYDWSTATHSESARENFEKGIASLVKMLPLYDLKKFSAYDLSYITMPGQNGMPHMNPGYHKLHIQLLLALGSITKNPFFKETAERWRSYVTTPRR